MRGHWHNKFFEEAPLNKRYTWAMVAVGGLAGAGAGIGSYFAGKPKKQNLNLGTPPKQITDYPVGHELNYKILSGLKGEGWGFPSEYLERSTSPYVAQLKADWPNTQRDIQDVYSARGLGRSTAGVRDIGLAASQRDRDINQILAQAYQSDLAQRKTDEARYQNLASQFVGQQAGQGNIVSQDEMQRRGFQIGQEQQFNAANMRNINDSISRGLSVASLVGGMGGVGGSGGLTYEAGTPAYWGALNQPAPAPFVGNQNQQFAQFLKFLGK